MGECAPKWVVINTHPWIARYTRIHPTNQLTTDPPNLPDAPGDGVTEARGLDAEESVGHHVRHHDVVGPSSLPPGVGEQGTV